MFFRHLKWAMLWALVILILCGIPGKDIPHISFLELLSFDKFVHAGIFFVLALLTAHGFMKQEKFVSLCSRPKLFTALFCIAYGGSLEIMQGTVCEGRTADIFDFVANSFGCLLALMLYEKIERQIFIRLN